MRLFLIVLLALFVPNAAVADGTLSDKTGVHRHTEAFMAQVIDNEIQAAYRQLRPHLGVAAEPYDQSATEAADYFERVNERVGAPLAASHVRTETIGDDFHRETWLQKFETAAIAWTFTFYRPRDAWKLVGVSYSTDIEPLYRRDQ
ncbi:MAG: hypothetical protein R3175_05310 [Marinobacter sp.]|uniref:hypothetical protein n=1 Tax=Marinobacter sp. TaxID=50741 RepID=UPI00299D23AA|nr:hypothetical protein [Marinobacter sp.]MDX1755462.1 hypothetical protein [Marinobacter sp.]